MYLTEIVKYFQKIYLVPNTVKENGMLKMKNTIGWIGNVAVVYAKDGRWLVDMSRGKKMFVKGGAE